MAQTYKSINLDAPAGSSSPPYSQSFVVASWSLNVSVYEITVPAATHGKGVIVSAQVFELVAGDYKEVETDITVATNGDVTLTISSSPDLRFDGRLVILGE